MFRQVFFLLFATACAHQSYASELGSITDASGPSWRDISPANFNQRTARYRADGFRMTDIDVYRVGNSTRMAQNWRRNDGRNWLVEHNLSSNTFTQRFRAHSSAGMRPTDIEAVKIGNTMRYAAIWVENRENIRWSLWRNMTVSSFAEKNGEQRQSGRVLVDVEAYDTPSGVRIAAIWNTRIPGVNTRFLRSMTRTQYQARINDYGAQGYALVDYEKYQNSQGQSRYMGLWKTGVQGRVIVRTNRNVTSYANLFRQYADEGYWPVDFERDGNSYGAIWMRASSTRSSYSRATQLRGLLSNYRSTTSNAPPGLSAAIVRNGRVIWRFGDGLADVAAGKEAHGGTIYGLASVSKVVGSTLFARLEERQALRNGTGISINASDRASAHIANLPARHTQTLAQIMSHRGCIPHYVRNTPSISNRTSHFSTQVAAVQNIWNTGLISSFWDTNNPPNVTNSCRIGTNTVYSTAGYTFLGAAIEGATNRRLADLIRSELGIPFNLKTLKATYNQSNATTTYDHAKLYEQNSVINGSNNSWKIIGGGLEASAIDLARFGWLTGSGGLVNSTTLNNRIMSADRAYGWRVGTVSSRRRINHGGSWSGFRSQLSVWPDDSLSIAILSNENDHSSGALRGLADSMANVVLAP